MAVGGRATETHDGGNGSSRGCAKSTGYRLFGERSQHLRQPGRAPFEFLSAAVHVLRRCQHQRRAVFPRLALRPRGEQRQSACDGDADLTAHVHRSCGAGEAISTTATLASSAFLTAFSQSSVPGTICSALVQTATPAARNRFANRRTISTSSFANDRKTCVRIPSISDSRLASVTPGDTKPRRLQATSACSPRCRRSPSRGIGRVAMLSASAPRSTPATTGVSERAKRIRSAQVSPYPSPGGKSAGR